MSQIVCEFMVITSPQIGNPIAMRIRQDGVGKEDKNGTQGLTLNNFLDTAKIDMLALIPVGESLKSGQIILNTS